ncbi:MAG: mechanosensitive ion channel [Flavobacteriales bacterium]|nr:mechanosensitive ion channel [Flavobacteriales bacterium]
MNLLNELKEALTRSLEMILDGFASALPKLILVIILLLVGWMVSKLVKKLIVKALKLIKLDDAMDRLELSPTLSGIGISSTAGFIGSVAYWMIMLIFLLTIAEVINMSILSEGIAAILSYIPQLLIALVILIFGMFIANMIKNLVYNATDSIGLKGARVISNIVYYVLFIFIAITAINQTGVDTSIITSNVTLIFGAMLLAFGISYGVASKDIMANMLSTFYRKDKFRIGTRIRVNGIEGVIKEMDSLSITLEHEGKQTVIPMKHLVENVVEVLH